VSKSSNIHVFWWSSVKFEGKPHENFGDIVSKYLVEKLSGKQVVWKHPKKHKWNPFHKKIYFTTGSVLAHVTKRCIVWGSGIISKQDEVDNAEFLAVRGPETYAYLTEKGYHVNKVFGDPAIVLPTLYNPEVTKTHDIGIIPHYVDYKKVADWYKDDKTIKVINLLDDDVSKKLSGDNIKFVDYFKSVNLQPYTANFIETKISLDELPKLVKEFPNLPEAGVIQNLCDELLKVCPFKN